MEQKLGDYCEIYSILLLAGRNTMEAKNTTTDGLTSNSFSHVWVRRVHTNDAIVSISDRILPQTSGHKK